MLFFSFNKTAPFFSHPGRTEGLCSLSRNSTPYRSISSIYNSVVTNLEGSNINHIHLKSQQILSQFNVCIAIAYLRNMLGFA